jgi:hypothetical protein
MAHLHPGHDYGIFIFSPTGAIIRRSKNLRGMRDYARVSRVEKVETRKDPANPHRGILSVTYADGCKSHAGFAEFHIMIDFVRSRRTWRGAEFHHADGEGAPE